MWNGQPSQIFCHCSTCAISLSEALLALFKLSMQKVFILKWLVNSWILMSCQPHRITSGWITKKHFFFLNLAVQSKIQVTTQVCLIHCYTVESQPFSHLPIYQCTVTHVLEPTLLLVFILYLRHSPWELIKLKWAGWPILFCSMIPTAHNLLYALQVFCFACWFLKCLLMFNISDICSCITWETLDT